MFKSIFKIGFLFSFVILLGCKIKNLPSVKYSQYTFNISTTKHNDTLIVNLGNPLHCPLRVWLESDDEDLQGLLNAINPIVMQSKADTSLTFANRNTTKKSLFYRSLLGSPTKKLNPIKLELPFPKNKAYKIIQANNTNYTHNTDYSRFAIDFNLKTNDTICAATSGYVVGVIDQYEFGGEGEEWRPYSNYLTIYHPDSGVFTQYVHLVKKGSLVEIGDKVEVGQPIALSGNTGQSSEEHLHFNTLKPVSSKQGLQSIPVEFVNGIVGVKLKKGDVVQHAKQ